MGKPIVAIATLFHEAKAYSYLHALTWVISQTYEPVEHVFKVHLGNYGDCSAVKRMRESVRQQVLGFEPDESHKLIQKVDALFYFDCDTIPSTDAIEQLLAVPGDIVTGIYFGREKGNRRAVCWKHSDSDQGFLDAEPVSVIDGAGMGCCLIRRPVLEACDWNYSIPDDDYPFWRQAQEKGFRLRSLNTLRCRHYINATEYSYQPFGVIQDAPVAEYTVHCLDGITINGKRYKGKVTGSAELIQTLREIDERWTAANPHVRRFKVEDKVPQLRTQGLDVRRSGEHRPDREPVISQSFMKAIEAVKKEPKG